jgi:hypothetical protein
MVAPVATARVTPTAKKPADGFKALITIALNPTIEFWETSSTPPGYDGGDPVDTTTQHNNTVRTKAPRDLIDMTDMTTSGLFNPAIYTSIRAVINKPTTITITWPDTSTLAFYGFVRIFAPGDLTEGGRMEGTITITVTNQDPTTGAEELPVYTPPVGGAAPMPIDPILQSVPGEPTAPGGPITQDSQWALEAAGYSPQAPAQTPNQPTPAEAPSQAWEDSYANAAEMELQTVQG